MLDFIKNACTSCVAKMTPPKELTQRLSRIYELTKVIEVVAIGLFVNSRTFGKGLALGSITFTSAYVLDKFLDPQENDQTEVANERPEGTPEASGVPKRTSWDIRYKTIIIPLIKEIAFRGVVQKATKWIFQKSLGCLAKSESLRKWGILPESIQIKGMTITPAHISILISSLAYVLTHRRSWSRSLLTLPAEIAIGKFADSDGIACAIAAHIANNTFSQITIECSSS
jgi:hypothetical protein